jgi:hypothetical protein
LRYWIYWPHDIFFSHIKDLLKTRKYYHSKKSILKFYHNSTNVSKMFE